MSGCSCLMQFNNTLNPIWKLWLCQHELPSDCCSICCFTLNLGEAVASVRVMSRVGKSKDDYLMYIMRNDSVPGHCLQESEALEWVYCMFDQCRLPVADRNYLAPIEKLVCEVWRIQIAVGLLYYTVLHSFQCVNHEECIKRLKMLESKLESSDFWFLRASLAGNGWNALQAVRQFSTVAQLAPEIDARPIWGDTLKDPESRGGAVATMRGRIKCIRMSVDMELIWWLLRSTWHTLALPSSKKSCGTYVNSQIERLYTAYCPTAVQRFHHVHQVRFNFIKVMKVTIKSIGFHSFPLLFHTGILSNLGSLQGSTVTLCSCWRPEMIFHGGDHITTDVMWRILQGTGPFQHGKLCPPGVDLQLQHLERTRLLLLEAKFIKFHGFWEVKHGFSKKWWNMMSCLFVTRSLEEGAVLECFTYLYLFCKFCCNMCHEAILNLNPNVARIVVEILRTSQQT